MVEYDKGYGKRLLAGYVRVDEVRSYTTVYPDCLYSFFVGALILRQFIML